MFRVHLHHMYTQAGKLIKMVYDRNGEDIIYIFTYVYTYISQLQELSWKLFFEKSSEEP